MAPVLPTLTPAPKVLPLISADDRLVQGLDRASLPPSDLEDTCMLHHAGIRQAVYVGTHILDRFCENPPPEGNHLPSALLFRHVLDIGDAIGTLLRFGSASSGIVLVRAIFEAVLGLKFILQDNKFHAERADCYWACFRIRQWENFYKYDPSTEQGRQFHQILDADSTLRHANFSRRDYSADRKLLEQTLSRKGYKETWDKYRHAKKHKQARDWYALCSGAKNIRELAALLGMEAQYAILYPKFSEIAHAADVITDVLNFKGGTGAFIHQVRGPEKQINTVASMTANYLLNSNQMMLDAYFPGKNDLRDLFGSWYLSFRPYFTWSFTPRTLGAEATQQEATARPEEPSAP